MDYLVHHMLRASARKSPLKEAIVCGDERKSYQQVWDTTSALAAGLRNAGIAKGDRVGVLLPPSMALSEAIFSVSQSGGVFVPMHHSLFPEQVRHIVTDCEMTAIITTSAQLASFRDVLKEIESVKFVVVVDDADIESCCLPIHRMSDILSFSCAAPPDTAIENDLAAILYTSGSTGRPKGVMLSHKNVVAGASIVSDYLSINADDRILAVLPFSFDAGLNQLTTSIQQGATLVVLPFIFARQIVDAVIKEEITALAGVPPLWSLLTQPSSTLRARLPSSVRYITNTGGALPLHVLAELRATLPQAEVFLMYGLTEAFRSTYLPPDQIDARPTSMGKAIPNTEILVLDDNGNPCAPGEIGELVHRGPTVSLGYWGQPELTRKVIRPNPLNVAGLVQPENVCYSGDLVKADEDGFLYFIGRKDNLIKTSGFRVSPTEVEEVLCQSDMLHEAAVVGLPDDMLGQRIKAFVVSAEKTEVDTVALIDFCTTHLPRHMIPKEVEIVDSLPKTGSGKVNYPALRQSQAESSVGISPVVAPTDLPLNSEIPPQPTP